jgi:hypothetical protein
VTRARGQEEVWLQGQEVLEDDVLPPSVTLTSPATTPPAPKRKTGDFIGLCLMGKSSRHISDSDSDVSDDSSPEGLSL